MTSAPLLSSYSTAPLDDLDAAHDESCELDYDAVRRQRDEALRHVRLLRAALGATGGAVVVRMIAPVRYECDECGAEHEGSVPCYELSLPGRTATVRVDRRDCLLIAICEELRAPEPVFDRDDIEF